MEWIVLLLAAGMFTCINVNGGRLSRQEPTDSSILFPDEGSPPETDGETSIDSRYPNFNQGFNRGFNRQFQGGFNQIPQFNQRPNNQRPQFNQAQQFNPQFNQGQQFNQQRPQFNQGQQFNQGRPQFNQGQQFNQGRPQFNQGQQQQFNPGPQFNQGQQFNPGQPQFNQNQGNQLQQANQATTAAPTPPPTTLSPSVTRCRDSCIALTTAEYNPVCGTDMQNYHNQARLDCARDCGVNVSAARAGVCNTLPRT